MIPRYKNLGVVVLPYENTGTLWVAAIGMSSPTFGTFTANTASVMLEVEDAQENIIDTYELVAANYVAAPASGGTILPICLPRKMLIPPGGNMASPNALIGQVQLIECEDTTSQDGKDSLENALMIST